MEPLRYGKGQKVSLKKLPKDRMTYAEEKSFLMKIVLASTEVAALTLLNELKRRFTEPSTKPDR